MLTCLRQQRQGVPRLRRMFVFVQALACALLQAVVPTGALGLAGAAPVLAAAAAQDSGRRLALVIGNSAYPIAALPNPVNDARAMAQALEQVGFAVMLRTDADQRAMVGAVREFGERLREAGSGAVGVFYYAGHGMQIRGRNFLVPVGADIQHEDEVSYAALDAQSVLDKMESAGNGTNLMILDACRNNPFARSFRSARQGLAQMDAPVGTLVAFSTAPGTVASDGVRGGNGLYTSHLLGAVRQPGLKVEEVFKQVRAGVLRESQGKQVPWESTALIGDFYFVGPPAAAAAPATAAVPPDATTAIDDALWAAVKDSTSSAELFAYLNRFPAGRHARDARTRLLDLAAPAAAPTAAAARPAPSAPTAGSAAAPESLMPWTEERRRASLDEGQRRLDEITMWGDVGTDRRPEQPRRNAFGLAEGDRFRWRLSELHGPGRTRAYLWRIDRVEADGSLWVNEGRQRLDARGQRRAGNDESSGVWLDFDPPLPMAEAAARGAGHEQRVATFVQQREADGRVTQMRLVGTLRTSGETVRPPRPLVDLLPVVCVRVELAGDSLRSDGVRRSVQWRQRECYGAPLPLPVSIELEQIADSVLVQHTTHELLAVDALAAAPLLAGDAAR